MQLPLRCLSILALMTSVHLLHDTKFLLVFSRHGARYAEHSSIDASKRGQLSNNGLRMGYQLGRYVRQTYNTFLPQKFNNKRSSVVASGLDRTRQYAEAIMLGVYDFGSLNDPVEVDRKYFIPEWKDFSVEDKYKTALPEGFQPVPIHSFYRADNYVFEPFDWSVCPLLWPYVSQKNDRTRKLEDDMRAFLVDVKKEFDYTTVMPQFNSFLDFYVLYDFVVSQKFLGKNLISDGMYKRMTILESIGAYLAYQNRDLLTYVTSGFLNIISAHLEEANKGLKAQKEDYRNLVLLVGHDMNIFQLNTLMGKVTYECLMDRLNGKDLGSDCPLLPPYGSSFFADVYNENGQSYVDFIVDGEKRAFCTADNNEKCSLDNFIGKIRSLLPSTPADELFNRFCRAKPADKNNYLLAIVAFNMVVIVFLIFLIFKLQKQLK